MILQLDEALGVRRLVGRIELVRGRAPELVGGVDDDPVVQDGDDRLLLERRPVEPRRP